MTASNKSCLVASVMFDIIHHVAWDFLVAIRYRCRFADGPESLVLEELLGFRFFSASCHLGIPIFLIDEDCFFMIAGNLKSVFVDRSIAKVLELGLVNHSGKFLGVLGVWIGTSSIQE